MMSSKSLWAIASAACLCFGVFLYGYTNIDKIFAARGDYYYGKNDLEKAQKYYETAIQLGEKSPERRENYVNSIINSPFDINAQTKLVKFLNCEEYDDANLKAEYFIYDTKREIFRKYSGNYIKKAVYNGKIVRWANNPVTYDFYSEEKIPAYFIKEIENAINEWEEALDKQVTFERSSNNPNIRIIFKDHNPATEDEGEEGGRRYVVAYTIPGINSENKLKNMQINFYLKDNEDEYFSPTQVYNTALHELVHALGFMGHSDSKKDVMYFSKDAKSVTEDTKAVLSQGDINTVKLLYDIKPEITNAPNPTGKYLPFIVLGNDKELTNIKLKEAKNYIKKAPNLPGGYIDLASGYVSAKDYPKAIKTLNNALNIANDNETIDIIYYNLAVCYFYTDNLNKAKDYLKKSIQIKDDEVKRYMYAEILLKEGNIENAIDEYGSLMKQHPKNAEYAIALANIYVRNHEYLKARKVLKVYFKNNPDERKNPRFAPYGIVRLGL